MKKVILCMMAIAIAIFVFSFTTPLSSISGKINPANGAEAVWAIHQTDSVKSPITLGMFNLAVKPGVYKVFIDAKEPYKDVTIDNLEIQGMKLELGEISLKQ